MNRQQFVPTLLQRQALAAYNDAHRDAIHHAERRMHRAVVPIMPPAEPKQPEPVNFCAPDDDAPKRITGGQLAIAGALWLVCMLGSLWLCTAAGMAFLDAIWRAK